MSRKEPEPRPVEELLRDLESNEPRLRIAAVVELGKHAHLRSDALLLVGKCIGDDGSYDASPGSTTIGPKFVPTVRGAVADFLPRMMAESPEGVRDLVDRIGQMSAGEKLVAILVLAKAPAMARELIHSLLPAPDGELLDIELVLLSHRDLPEAQDLFCRAGWTPDAPLESLKEAAAKVPANPLATAALADSLEKSLSLVEAKAVWSALRRVSATRPRCLALAEAEIRRLEEKLRPVAPDEVAKMNLSAMLAALKENPWRVFDALVTAPEARKVFARTLNAFRPNEVAAWAAHLSKERHDPRVAMIRDACSQAARRAFALERVIPPLFFGLTVALSLVVYVLAPKSVMAAPFIGGLVTIVGAGAVMADASKARLRWKAASAAEPILRQGSRRLVSWVCIVLAVAFAASSVFAHRDYRRRHRLDTFDQWGVSFSYPYQWREGEPKFLDSLKSQLRRAGANPREVAVLRHGEGMLVTVILAPRSETAEAFLEARRKQLDDAKAAGDVKTIHQVELTTFQNRPAVVMDVTRANGGRGRELHVVFDGQWLSLSLVADAAAFDQYKGQFAKMLETVRLQPSH